MSEITFPKIEASKKQRVITLIRDAILSGSIDSGEPLLELTLARQFGVGQPLIREALIELHHLGFVQRRANKGTFVTKLTQKDVEQIYGLRIELEPLALQLAGEISTPADLQPLRQLAEEMLRTAKARDFRTFYEVDFSFHRTLWQLSRNPWLVDTLERLVTPLFAFFIMKNLHPAEAYIENSLVHLQVADGFFSTDMTVLKESWRQALLGFKQGWSLSLEG